MEIVNDGRITRLSNKCGGFGRVGLATLATIDAVLLCGVAVVVVVDRGSVWPFLIGAGLVSLVLSLLNDQADTTAVIDRDRRTITLYWARVYAPRTVAFEFHDVRRVLIEERANGDTDTVWAPVIVLHDGRRFDPLRTLPSQAEADKAVGVLRHELGDRLG